MLGEASHGTQEFYHARAAITRRFVEKHGFTIVNARFRAGLATAGHQPASYADRRTYARGDARLLANLEATSRSNIGRQNWQISGV